MNTTDLSDSLMTLSELITAVNGCMVESPLKDTVSFLSVVTDSRNVKPGSLFIPLVGERQDGHMYIPQAIENGASVIFVAKSFYNKSGTKLFCGITPVRKVRFIVVENTLTALQQAAAAYVSKFPHLIRIGITGSSGKTTTKEITAAILRQKYVVITNEGNLNSETGLPLSVFKIRREHEIGVFEMGMNRRNEIGELATVLKPQYALITNIGTAHIGILGSRQNIATEKKKIFTYLGKDGVALIPADDDFADFLADDNDARIVRYGTGITSSKNGVEFISDDGVNGTVFSVDGMQVRLPLPGKYNYVNALAAIAIARCFNISASQIVAGISSVKTIPGRGQYVSVPLDTGTLSVIQDCYNANPDSMNKALEFISSLKTHGRKICVLGDMLELGADSPSAHSQIGEQAAGSGSGLVIFVGKEMEAAAASAKSHRDVTVEYISDHDNAAMRKVAEIVRVYARDGDVLLLKGSRGMQLERVTAFLKTSGSGDGQNE